MAGQFICNGELIEFDTRTGADGRLETVIEQKTIGDKPIMLADIMATPEAWSILAEQIEAAGGKIAMRKSFADTNAGIVEKFTDVDVYKYDIGKDPGVFALRPRNEASGAHPLSYYGFKDAEASSASEYELKTLPHEGYKEQRRFINDNGTKPVINCELPVSVTIDSDTLFKALHFSQFPRKEIIYDGHKYIVSSTVNGVGIYAKGDTARWSTLEPLEAIYALGANPASVKAVMASSLVGSKRPKAIPELKAARAGTPMTFSKMEIEDILSAHGKGRYAEGCQQTINDRRRRDYPSINMTFTVKDRTDEYNRWVGEKKVTVILTGTTKTEIERSLEAALGGRDEYEKFAPMVSGISISRLPGSTHGIDVTAHLGEMFPNIEQAELGKGISRLGINTFSPEKGHDSKLMFVRGIDGETLPDKLIIRDKAFENCKRLTSLELGASTLMNAGAVKGCDRLKAVCVPAKEDGTPNMRMKVPLPDSVHIVCRHPVEEKEVRTEGMKTQRPSVLDGTPGYEGRTHTGRITAAVSYKKTRT